MNFTLAKEFIVECHREIHILGRFSFKMQCCETQLLHYRARKQTAVDSDIGPSDV